MGEKKRGKNFTRNKRISRAKNDGKKSSGKSGKTCFFNKHMNIVTKNGEKNARKKFFQKHTDFASKQRWKKIVRKKCENTFLINTRISSSNNGGKKTRQKIFPKTHE